MNIQKKYHNQNNMVQNALYNHVLNKLQDYMFNKNTMNNAIKYEIKKIEIKNQNNKYTCDDKNKSITNNKNSYLIPKEKDSLFWCFYILKYGEIKYEIEDKNILNEKKIKIDLINKIRENKNILKKYKFDNLSNIENNLVNDDIINLKTFFSLCCIENINILMINEKNKYYYEFFSENNDNDNDKNFYYIYDLSYIKKYGISFNLSQTNINDYYKIDSINKPIKSLSSYKIEDLIKISEKLNINIYDKNTNKIKNKKEIYETLIQYF